MNTLGITLKKLRESRNLTIIQLAELAGTGKGTIGDIETGKSKSTVKTLEKISKALKLNEKERSELFAEFVPKDIGAKIITPQYKALDKKGRMQLNDLLQETSLMFNDETISEEDKKKMLDAITDAFYDAKAKNKRKK
ncbi:MAG: helix-turn-helix transcriptional regulator [Fusobacterium gastrosuis]|uniref:helix-turn-helix domain-containing protein n=1 Tax=Fusobacterium gastrosuis TaxID=1755100 RepID=UPI002A95978A|nr:helix-turn-helix transcriptional regulator [Fusobacterium gastrosuis]